MRTLAEIETALNDRTEVSKLLTQVDKGRKGTFTYVPWHSTQRQLDRIFGPFGWSAEITDRDVTSSDGAYVYSVGLKLTVHADDGHGNLRTVSRPGVGVGIASPNRDGVLSADAHDTALKAARSDALSVAAKGLGDAFGLFLYDKGDPATQTGVPVAKTGTTHTNTPTTASRGTGASSESPTRSSDTRRPSEKQNGVLRKAGYQQDEIDSMDFPTWKGCIDAVFGMGEAPVKPGQSTPTGKKPQGRDEELDMSDDSIPF